MKVLLPVNWLWPLLLLRVQFPVRLLLLLDSVKEVIGIAMSWDGIGRGWMAWGYLLACI